MRLTEFSDYIWSLRDPRTEGWSLSADYKFIFPLIALYLYVVKIKGPELMKSRPAYNLKPYILTYNAAMVITNAFFFWNYWKRSYGGGGYNLFCQGISYSTDKNSMEILELTWWYVLVRIADFIDTIFFLLRKKYEHISTLHVVHHTLVVFSGWLWLNFGSDGQVLLGICFNAFIHVIMYSYYGFAALGPWTRKYLWWKKYLTKLQIFQFLFLNGHILIPLFYDCGYPRPLIFLAVAQGLLGLTLFINFYIEKYCSSPAACRTIKMTPGEEAGGQRLLVDSRKNA
ncbi:elongation of very long chain fatty acids protein 4 [Galendromus occidentalis]|uniref:Elongation of very long chain fatty acids protein n=1 Tax=Galendromus occidentalis TaxID=34638 RepID=A0AAJ7P973_9ACAR|nr:elongation of very long chain fatty acids protein 4 [Galendromus occidentalis]XP_018494280.1 elongation of very long chain fatty acids protein 4 [Galendromus occidentalis]